MMPQKTKKAFKISVVITVFLAITLIPTTACKWDIAPGWTFAATPQPSQTTEPPQPTTADAENTAAPTPSAQPTQTTPTQTANPTHTSVPSPITKEERADFALYICFAVAITSIGVGVLVVLVRRQDSY